MYKHNTDEAARERKGKKSSQLGKAVQKGLKKSKKT